MKTLIAIVVLLVISVIQFHQIHHLNDQVNKLWVNSEYCLERLE